VWSFDMTAVGKFVNAHNELPRLHNRLRAFRVDECNHTDFELEEDDMNFIIHHAFQNAGARALTLLEAVTEKAINRSNLMCLAWLVGHHG
jgi:hypothetical protein